MHNLVVYNQYAYEGYLQHFGIRGQKWGIRRFQNEDRSFTEAGKRRYYPERLPFLVRKVPPASEKEKHTLQKRISEATAVYKRTANTYANNMYNKYNLAKEKTFLAYHDADKKLKDLKILQKLQNKKYISQHQLNLVQKYKDQGMTEEQAKIQAYKRVRTEKIIAIAATTTVAMAAMQISKVNNANLDHIIPKGMRVQNLSADSEKGVHDAFYASFDKGDNNKYLNLFGGDFMQQEARAKKALFNIGDGKVPVAKLTAEAMTDVKIAGANVAKDVADQLIKTDPSYKRALVNMLNDPQFEIANAMQPGGFRGYNNLKAAISGGKLNGEGYNLINTLLVNHDNNGQTANNILYDALRKKGYDGLVDINDIFNSGYDAKKPVIIFNGGPKLGNISRQMIDPDTLKLGAALELGKVFLKEAVKSYAPMGLAIAGITSLSKSGVVKATIYRRRVIREYKKLHPGTQLTDSQILQNQIGEIKKLPGQK